LSCTLESLSLHYGDIIGVLAVLDNY